MTTTHHPLNEICGASWRYSGPLQDAHGAALNLAGATLQWRLDSADGATNIAACDNGGIGGIEVLDNACAVILVTVLPSVTADIAPGNYVDWMIATLADGSVLYMWTGVIRAVAKPA
jgi:hypothetical protein